MCGIAGVFTPGRLFSSEETLHKMLFMLKHRGPDEFGIYCGPDIGLAHARLSIIDLCTGQQPMCNEDETFWIVFNGEIFNYLELRKELISKGHIFKTESDTEVILHLFEEKGTNALSSLNGQFAFAIWDLKRKELFLARDRVGICPLFYTKAGNDWIFASEIKAIFAHNKIARRLDRTALDDVFTFWFSLSPRSGFEGVKEIPPAHILKITESEESFIRYWDMPTECDRDGLRSEEYYADHLRELLIDSAKIRLRADVPVGAYLSGGLDSSVTASLIRKYSNCSLCTFSVMFEDSEFDESPKQRTMSEYLGTIHRGISCSDYDISESIATVVWHTEVPIIRTAPVPLYLLSRLVRESEYKVVLTGEGADEILAGYDLFKEMKVRRFIEKYPESKLRPLLLRRLYPYLRQSPTQSLSYAKAFFGAPIEPFDKKFFSHAPRWNMSSMNKIFYSDDLREELTGANPADRIHEFFGDPGKTENLDTLGCAQEIEFKTLLPRYLLSSQGDRMLMANSVEGRFPFLDHRVVEFCMKIPSRLRMKALEEKYILRKSMSGLIPAEIAKMVKQPYRAPDARCFFGRKRETIVDHLLSKDSIIRKGYFDPVKVDKLIEKCRRNPNVGFRDNMAFIGILSTQLVDKLFVEDFNASQTIPISKIRVIREKKC